jgi:hypothetical protein
MAGRGPQSFKKRQKEQVRKEKQQEKLTSSQKYFVIWSPCGAGNPARSRLSGRLLWVGSARWSPQAA